MDYPGRLIAGLIAVVLIIIFPLQYIAQSGSEDIDAHICNETKALADSIREKGYLDQAMYEGYLDFLNHTGDLYDIEIEDIHPITADEVAVNNCSICLASDGFHNEEHTANSVSNVLQKEFVGKAIQTAAGGSHVHTDACYAGHRHNESECSYRKYYATTPGNYIVVENRDSGMYSSYINRSLRCSYGHYLAMISYEDYPIDNIEYGWNGSAGDNVSFSGSYVDENNKIVRIGFNSSMYLTSLVDDGTGWVSNGSYYRKPNPDYSRYYNAFWSLIINYDTPNYPYWEMFGFKREYGCAECIQAGYVSATLVSEWTCNQTQDETPICDRVVTGIVATQPSQTVTQGNPIVTTAQAMYLNGTTGTVNCTTSGYNPNILGNQTVTLTYSGLINNAKTTGNLQCKVDVFVRPARTLTSIIVTPATQIIDRYENPNFTVRADYSDGSYATVGEGQYILSDFDSAVLGAQTVTVSYTENGITKSAQVTVNVNGLTSISAAPALLTVERYTLSMALSFTITATYLYGSDRTYTSGYVTTGYQPALLGEQLITITYTDKGITKSTTVRVNVTVLHKECPICHNIYDLSIDDSDPGCPFCRELVTEIKVSPEYLELTQGDELPVTVQAVYSDKSSRVVSGWTSNYDSNRLGLQIVRIEYGGYAAEIMVNVLERMMTCPECGTRYPLSAAGCPVCAETVIGLYVIPESLIVHQHENIDITVIAYFADGSSRQVYDWSIDTNTSRAGVYTARVTYKTALAFINLTVLGVSDEECPICGTIYDMVENPNGCPVCYTCLTGIEAYLLNGSDKVQYGTKPDIGVILTFRDGHRELLMDDYVVENYNPYILGHQTITVIYEEYTAILILEVVNTLSYVICPYGHVYYLNEDGTDSGCPYCFADSYSGTVRYYDITYISDIIDSVYTTGAYYFSKGNYITIKVTKRDKSLLYRLQSLFFKTSLLGRKKVFVYGGEVY